MRNLLLLSYHFPPSAASASFRLLGFCRHLPKFGWRLIVVAPPQMPGEARDEELSKKIPPETVLAFTGYPRGKLSYPARVLLPHLCWFPAAWGASTRVIRQYQPDALLTSGPYHTVHVLGRLLKKRYQFPWIADFRDPWFAGNALGSARGNRVTRWWEGREEKAVMAQADLIVGNAPNASVAMAQAFPEARSKIVTITNGFDPEVFAGLEGPAVSQGDRAIEVLHTGTIYAGRDPRPFVHALREVLVDRPPSARPIHLTLMGTLGASQASELGAEIRASGLEHAVSVIDQVPYRRCLAMMCQADILLLLDSPGRRIGVPAKAYEYIGTGRPVLALAEPNGDTAWVLRESGAPHRIAPPDDPGAIRRALSELIDLVESSPNQGRLSPRNSRFTRENLTGELAAALDRLVTRPAIGSPMVEPAASEALH